jgi:hypothetical protein
MNKNNRGPLAVEVLKKENAFLLKWIDQKYRDGSRITARDYQECMDWLAKMRGSK